MQDNNRAQEELLLPSKTPGQHHKHETNDRLALFSERILDRADTLIYSIVGLLFLIGALFALGYSIWNFVVGIQGALGFLTAKDISDNIATGIITFISDLLLVLIIMEVLSTIIQYLKAHATSLRPFLFIGIISAIRSVLSIGAKLSVGEVKDFNEAMIELGVSAAVVLALGITLKLLGRMVDIDSSGD